MKSFKKIKQKPNNSIILKKKPWTLKKEYY